MGNLDTPEKALGYMRRLGKWKAEQEAKLASGEIRPEDYRPDEYPAPDGTMVTAKAVNLTPVVTRRDVPFETLQGLTLSSIDNGCDEVTFRTECGRTFRMYHEGQCCEQVDLEDVSGDLDDLVGERIVTAAEAMNTDATQDLQWFFYTLRSVNTTVQMRWCGQSNGFYSIEVSFEELVTKDRI